MVYMEDLRNRRSSISEFANEFVRPLNSEPDFRGKGIHTSPVKRLDLVDGFMSKFHGFGMCALRGVEVVEYEQPQVDFHLWDGFRKDGPVGRHHSAGYFH
jgi:hypothetical protein